MTNNLDSLVGGKLLTNAIEYLMRDDNGSAFDAIPDEDAVRILWEARIQVTEPSPCCSGTTFHSSNCPLVR